MILKITYRCQNCMKERAIELSEDSSSLIPDTWLRDEVSGGYALDFCSGLCRDKFRRMHPSFAGSAVPLRVAPIKFATLGHDLLQSIFTSSEQAMRDATDQLSQEFGVPPEIVPEFGFHLQTILCPKCGAKKGEPCRIMEGDETTVCPVHETEELKLSVHRERVVAARKTWKAKMQ